MTDASSPWQSAGARLAFVALIAGAMAIAFSPIFVRLSDLNASVTAFWRPALALPALWLLMRVEGRAPDTRQARPRSRRDAALLALAGFLFAGDLFFWHWSIQYTSVANSTLFANFAPLFVALASWLVFGERFSRTFLAALALGLAGAIVLMGDSLTIGLDHLFGDALGLTTAMFYGGYIIVVGRLRSRFSTAVLMAWTSLVTALILLPVALVSGQPMLPAALAGWGVLLGLSLISHAGGQSLIAYALAHLPAAFSSLSLLVQPVAAAVLAWAILGEPLSLLQAVGGAIILSAILLARRGSRPRPVPPAPTPTPTPTG
ncbi:MAG: DMT family transporter [Inquilinus sp.]|nr:DMT family transporter [Inquilinus sp.]